MLVLDRVEGDVIHIGQEIVIHLVSVTNRHVLICIQAPESMKVLRG